MTHIPTKLHQSLLSSFSVFAQTDTCTDGPDQKQYSTLLAHAQQGNNEVIHNIYC